MSKVFIRFDRVGGVFRISLPSDSAYNACLYTLKWVFEQRLGLSFIIDSSPVESQKLEGNECRRVVLRHFLKREHVEAPRLQRLVPNSAPCFLALNFGFPVRFDQKVPIILGDNSLLVSEEEISCGADLIGSIFFLLSRYEEFFSNELDKHHRFNVGDSVLSSFDGFDMPLADYYVEVIWSLLKKMWPFLERKESQASVWVTCDVDWPFDLNRRSAKAIAGKALGYLRNYSIATGLRAMSKMMLQVFNSDDPFLVRIFWIMDVNEAVNRKVMFFFIPLVTSKYDPSIDFFDERVQFLISVILSRGHDVGIHPGYATASNVELFRQSVSRFRKVVDKYRSSHDISLVCRQHFLRWSCRTTPLIQEEVGVDIDSSLCFAGRSGFRAGTSHSFPMFSLSENRELKLVQKPLIVMESTVIHRRYEGLGYTEAAFDRFLALKEECFKVGGTFTFLWHNSNILLKDDENFYLELIK